MGWTIKKKYYSVAYRRATAIFGNSLPRTQASLNEELLSLERVSANVEVRRGIMRKQQSLPTAGGGGGGKQQQQQPRSMGSSLKERLQQLRAGWQRLSSSGSKEEEEEEEEEREKAPSDGKGAERTKERRKGEKYSTHTTD